MEPLLPERHPTRDFFVANLLDAVPRDDMASMEHPLFSLSTKEDGRELIYENANSRLRIIPSRYGLPTIFDKDILIYCISQLVAAINEGRTPSKAIRMTAYDFLVATNRHTDGRTYERVKQGLIRLRSTTYETNIKTNGQEITKGFGLIESYEIVREEPVTGRMSAVEITLSDWVYQAVLAREVLSISRDYFRLRRPLERRLYELARKHCGKQASWTISLPTLKLKLGTTAPTKKLRLNVREIAANDHLPDYRMRITANDHVVFSQKGKSEPVMSTRPVLHPDTYIKARKLAPGWDIYQLESEWVDWWRSRGATPLKSPDAAFVGFCRRRFEKKGTP